MDLCTNLHNSSSKSQTPSFKLITLQRNGEQSQSVAHWASLPTLIWFVVSSCNKNQGGSYTISGCNDNLFRTARICWKPTEKRPWCSPMFDYIIPLKLCKLHHTDSTTTNGLENNYTTHHHYLMSPVITPVPNEIHSYTHTRKTSRTKSDRCQDLNSNK